MYPTTFPLLDTVKNNKYLLIKFSGDEVGNMSNIRERDLTIMIKTIMRAKDTIRLRPLVSLLGLRMTGQQ